MPQEQHHPFFYTVAAWILTGVALVLVLFLHLLPALIAGLLVYELVHVMAPAIHRRFPNQRATLVAVALLSGIVMGLVSALAVGLVLFFNSDAGSVSVLLAKMADILETSRATMPGWFAGMIPDRPEDMNEAVVQWLRTHATMVRLAGAEAGRFLLYVVAGMVLGAMIVLSEVSLVAHYRPLSAALIERATRLSRSFRRVVFAQVKISLLNTLFTGIYLTLILPLVRRASAAQENADRRHVHHRAAAGRGQPAFQHRDRGGEPVLFGERRDRLAGVPGRDPQARVPSQRPHHRQPRRIAHVGAAHGDARDGSRLRHRRA